MNLNTQLTDVKGNPIEQDEMFCPTCKRPIAPTKMLLRDVLINALGSEKRGPHGELQETISGEDKIKWFHFGIRLAETDDIELKAEEIVLLKSRVEKFYPAFIYGRVCELLEPPKQAEGRG